MRKLQGFSLTEILISLTITGFLLSTLLYQYSSVRRHYEKNRVHIEDAQDLFLSMDLMRMSLRQAGFTPCGNVTRLNPSLKALIINPDALHGFRVQRMSAEVTQFSSWSSKQGTLMEKAHFNTGDLVLVSDCLHAELHTVARVSRRKVVLRESLGYAPHFPLWIGLWIQESFYIRPGKMGLMMKSTRADCLAKALVDLDVALQFPLITVQLHPSYGDVLMLQTRMRNV